MRAPLNSRVGITTAASKGKGKAKEEEIGSLSVQLQEAMILEDLLFVLMVCAKFCVPCFTFVTYERGYV